MCKKQVKHPLLTPAGIYPQVSAEGCQEKKMKMNRLFFTLMFVAGSQLMHGQIVDRVLLGQEESEKSHGLTVYCPEHTMTVHDGFMGESGRGVRRFEQNPVFRRSTAGIYGGEYHFVLRVDGTKQNYLTLRTIRWRQDSGRRALSGTDRQQGLAGLFAQCRVV